MGFLSFLFKKNNLKDALKKGAFIIDVRTPQEYDNGHTPDAINIPVDRLAIQVDRLTALKQPIICCSNQDERSSKAVAILKSKGKKDVYNGGGWKALYELQKNL